MVKLRKKKLSQGKLSLYLDVYDNGVRRYEFLKLYITNDRCQNKETLKLAEGIRAKKEIELRSNEYGFIPDFKKRINFVDYMYSVAKNKNQSSRYMFKNTINYVEAFSNGYLPISKINEIWLAEFEKFMTGKLSKNSIVDYMQVICITLNNAVYHPVTLMVLVKYYFVLLPDCYLRKY